MATITLYAGKIDNMPSLIKDVKKSVKSYNSELISLKKASLSINKSICDLDDIISSVQASSQIQEEKFNSLDSLEKENERFAAEVQKTDTTVADIVRNGKDDFYSKYSHLKPDCEKGELERFWDGCKSGLKKAAEWCKEHWVMVVTVLVVIAIAIVAVVTFGVAIAAIAAIAGVVSLVLCMADVICMLVTGGKSISDVCRENGMGWLGEIFDGISVGCDIVSIVFPAGAAIKSMAKVGVKSFVKGSMRAMKAAFKETIEKVFKSGFKNGVKNLGKIAFKTFIFDIDDFSRVNSSGKRVFDIFEHTPTAKTPKNIELNSGGLNADGSLKYKADGTIDWPENNGFIGTPDPIALESGARIDRFGDDFGTFVSPDGTPYENRALTPGTNNTPYNLYEVVKPIDNTLSGTTASWFNEPGGGLQLKLSQTIDDLLKNGSIKMRNSFYYAVKGVPPTIFRNSFEFVTASGY